jgi:oxepin-CoA hydrolase/3-oxo-5,6-dehydrosuberyl-CoA semialdehyde dehydrogenase
MERLRHYVHGGWAAGEGESIPVHDAMSGAQVATVAHGGLDLAAAYEHARSVGGAALRAMTFAERALVLKRLSSLIHEHREALIDASRQGGTTRGDAKFDIDGAAGTLSYYAYLGKGLGDGKVLLDGEAEPVLRSKRFVAQHIWVPRHGVAVHINAYNFPAWGMAEKLASAFLAGVPVITKPAPATAPLATRIVELWVESGVLPPGSLTLINGEPLTLLDHVGAQDAVAFTGSAETGRIIRSHPAVVASAARVNVEADSVNAAVVGPDVEAGSDVFWMFVNQTALEMTQKAGQKCTATRRILVPEHLCEAISEALIERLSASTVGDPAQKGTRVGPVVDAAAQARVLQGLAALESAGERLWSGEAPTEGAFIAPTLLQVPADSEVVHAHEVFGPVACVLPYSGEAADAVAIVARGGGGLVCSLYSDDRAWSQDVVLGLAPWHGRIHWGSKRVHDQSPGPGVVLPSLVHGGPGRAGGGEELGGLRGLRFYQQRTVIQGDRGLLPRILPTSST